MNWFQWKLVNVRIAIFAKRRRRAFDRHLRTLSPGERRSLATGSHPSQNPENAIAAVPMASLLQEDLLRRGIAARVTVALYHADRLVLSADVSQAPQRRRKLPYFFRGYEVKYHWPQ
jgi:hypothetical protein